MRQLDEVKPKVKEYASIQDYFDDVIAKTYDLVEKEEDKQYGKNHCVHVGDSKISYERGRNPWADLVAKMTIDISSAACVEASVKKPYCDRDGNPEPNAELIVRRKNLTNLGGVNHLGFYKEIEGILKTGLKGYENAMVSLNGSKGYESARVAYKR